MYMYDTMHIHILDELPQARHVALMAHVSQNEYLSASYMFLVYFRPHYSLAIYCLIKHDRTRNQNMKQL